MLYPQSNPYRQVMGLDGFWDFRFDPDEEGKAAGWSGGFAGARPIAVPASWNDQFADHRDYQAEFIERTIQVLRTRPFVVGEHVWNLCDFKTGQAVHRGQGLNLKGVFTRDRRPKLAAHKLRELWKD